VIRPQRLFVDGERAPVERLGVGIAVLTLIEKGKFVQGPWQRWDARGPAPSREWQESASSKVAFAIRAGKLIYQKP
jgi:hypothetical protein